MVKETIIDNSNPQQGSSSNHPANAGKSDPHANNSPPASTQRRLKIPPNKRDSRKLFVGGLPPDITNEEFVEFFSQFGELFDCLVMFDRETGRSRGFGFVTYVDPEVSARLLSMGDNDDQNVGRLRMREKLVEVKAAQPKPGDGRRSFPKSGMKQTNNGSFPPNRPPAPASMDPTPQVNFYAPDSTIAQPIHNYYPSYDANGAHMPGIYGSLPADGVTQHGYQAPHPAYFPVGPAVVPMAHTHGVEMGQPGMMPFAPVPHLSIQAAATATSIPTSKDTGLPVGAPATAVPWNHPQQPLLYVPVMPTSAATVMPPFVVPPHSQAMPDITTNSQQKQMSDEELKKQAQM